MLLDFFGGSSHKYNDTTRDLDLGLDWSSFWWNYGMMQIPTWSQHALCFFKCKFQGLNNTNVYPESYKNFELCI